MSMTPNERYHARLESLGIPHQHNRRNPLHPMHFVSSDLERIFCFAKLNLRIDKPLTMLLAYWPLHNKAAEKFETAKDRTALQTSNFQYYVTDGHDMVMLYLIKRLGGVGDILRVLDKEPLYDIDGTITADIERIAIAYRDDWRLWPASPCWNRENRESS